MTISAFSDELAQVRTKKKEFLSQIERIVPWKEWLAMYSVSLRSSCASEKHDTEALKSSKPNSISCLRWQIWFWLTDPVWQLELVRFADRNQGVIHSIVFGIYCIMLILAFMRCCLRMTNWNNKGISGEYFNFAERGSWPMISALFWRGSWCPDKAVPKWPSVDNPVQLG